MTPEREQEIRAWAAGGGRDMRALTETLDALAAMQERVQRLEGALLGVSAHGPCWCASAYSQGEWHTEACQAARAVIGQASADAAEGPGVLAAEASYE